MECHASYGTSCGSKPLDALGRPLTETRERWVTKLKVLPQQLKRDPGAGFVPPPRPLRPPPSQLADASPRTVQSAALGVELTGVKLALGDFSLGRTLGVGSFGRVRFATFRPTG